MEEQKKSALMPVVDIATVGDEQGIIQAKTAFVAEYAAGQRSLIETEAAAQERVLKAEAEKDEASSKAFAAILVEVMTSPGVAGLLAAKAQQMTAENDLAKKKLEIDAETEKRRDENEATMKKRRDIIGAVVLVCFFAIVGGLSILAVYLVSANIIDAKALAVVVGTTASAVGGVLIGRRNAK